MLALVLHSKKIPFTCASELALCSTKRHETIRVILLPWDNDNFLLLWPHWPVGGHRCESCGATVLGGEFGDLGPPRRT
jgi:hypothetical protein